MKHYFNTTHLKGIQLDMEVQICKKQEDRILGIYKTTKLSLSPSQVWYLYQQYFTLVPLTSIRRGITTLCTHNLLEKTNLKSMGMYGKFEYQWKS